MIKPILAALLCGASGCDEDFLSASASSIAASDDSEVAPLEPMAALGDRGSPGILSLSEAPIPAAATVWRRSACDGSSIFPTTNDISKC